MKKIKINRCYISEIFRYAEKIYGISWNACDDIFLQDCVLDYGKMNTVYWGDCLDYIEEELKIIIPEYNTLSGGDLEKVISGFSVELVNSQKDDIKANIILMNFMTVNGVDEMEVDCE